MATNDFIGFASSGNANIASQADYAAAAEQGIGMQPGPASSKLANKAWRQGANMAAALGQIAAARGYDALDNGDLNALQSSIDDTISVGTFNRMYFSQTSGSYTAPRTGIYRITLKGGGGGGGRVTTSANSSGSGGGEGATLIFYETLTKGQSYSYVIGAGGTAGSSGSSASGGGNGGETTFNSSYTTKGGFGGAGSGNIGKYGGGGGNGYVAPSGAVVHFSPGAAGVSNGLVANGGAGASAPATGGGSGGSSNSTQPATYGGGGCGASPIYSGTDAVAGGDGYILIEYAG